MWKIKHIDCENFISFKSVSVDIPENVCTLIYGINLDNDRQKNNGTGKSSLVEAIAFGLTGEPLRGVDKTEEIINDHSDTAHIHLELVNDYNGSNFTIDRTIDRKQPQVIECHKYDENGTEIESDKTSQPTVLDYNRYILDEIGLTKDDIYSNFILSSSKYKSFFDASDRTKKAMINRFSGADAVDKALEELLKDKVPVEQALTKAKENKIAIDSKIEVIEQQIAEADSKKEEFEREKQERIDRLQAQISEKREEKRNNNEQKAKANKRLDDIDEAGALIDDMQGKGYDLSTAYAKINGLLAKYNLSATKDYLEMSRESESKIHKIQEKKNSKQSSLDALAGNLTAAQNVYDTVKAKFDSYKADCERQNQEADADLKDIESDIKRTEQAISEQFTKIQTLKDTSDKLDRLIRESHNLLHGVIVCPKCKHEFFLDENISVEDVRQNLRGNEQKLEANEASRKKADEQYDKLKADKESFKQEKEAVNKEISLRSDKLYELRRELNEASSAVDNVRFGIVAAQKEIEILNGDIELENSKISSLLKNMIQEAFDIIDNTIDKGERYVKTLDEKNVAVDASISAYEKSIETVRNSSQSDFIRSLDKSHTEYQKTQQTANMSLLEAQKEFDKFTLQENYFTEFRSYLANKKVEAIAGVTNYFLELIGSDLRVEMLGFKRLRNGAIRDKITVNVLRNGIPMGSVFKYSQGERSRINLASILGLQRLTNNSAENGKGLDLLIADEILDSEDTTGIEATCEALNKLKITSLIVTQNPISTNDGETIRVTKENGFSKIEIE